MPLAPLPDLTRGRRWFVHAVIALVLGFSLLAVVCQGELWPFSNYPMYSTAQKAGHHVIITLIGMSRDPAAPPVPLLHERHIRPLGMKSFRAVMDCLFDRPERLRQLADGWLRDYELCRQPQEPPLMGVRICRLTYCIDPQADCPRQLIASQTLVEVMTEE